MIHTIAVKTFRGFQDFRLEGLTELTILTGRMTSPYPNAGLPEPDDLPTAKSAPIGDA